MNFEQKLTSAQKDEIFEEFLRADDKARYHFATVKAAELGVSHSTIQRIIRDKKRTKKYLDRVNEIRDLQMARMWANAGAAVDVHIDIINRQREFGVNMATVPQQSANSLLDRIGLKAQKDDASTKVVFEIGGLDVGMPEKREDA